MQYDESMLNWRLKHRQKDGSTATDGYRHLSPPLNEQDHSVRGVKVCEDLVQHFSLHIFETQAGRAKLSEAWATEHPRQWHIRGPDIL
ncbi:MAG: glutaminase [Chloroflexales bacterium]|nr:glutaminase [Chloroflexales bacterium]